MKSSCCCNNCNIAKMSIPISKKTMLKIILVISLLFSCLEGGGGGGERREEDLVAGEAGGRKQRIREEGMMKDQGRLEVLEEEGVYEGFVRIGRRRREVEGDEVWGGGSVVDGRSGYICTLPFFPCTRYSHKCCHGGSCRSLSQKVLGVIMILNAILS